MVDKVSQEGYFTKGKADKKKGEEAFFKQGEKAEVSLIRDWSRSSAAWVLII